MTMFVLVHGAWHGPWAWDRVVPLLHAAGARTLTPDLGTADDRGLHDDAATVVAALDRVPEDDELVLVGHSYAVLVVREAADAGATQWLSARLVPQPLRTFTEATCLTGAVDRIPGTAVHCRPRTYPFDRFGRDVGYRTRAMNGPHDVMLTDPETLTDLLLAVRSFKNEKDEV